MSEFFRGPFFFTGLCLIIYLLACRLQLGHAQNLAESGACFRFWR